MRSGPHLGVCIHVPIGAAHGRLPSVNGQACWPQNGNCVKPFLETSTPSAGPFDEERLGYVSFPLTKIAKLTTASLAPLLKIETGGEID